MATNVLDPSITTVLLHSKTEWDKLVALNLLQDNNIALDVAIMGDIVEFRRLLDYGWVPPPEWWTPNTQYHHITKMIELLSRNLYSSFFLSLQTKCDSESQLNLRHTPFLEAIAKTQNVSVAKQLITHFRDEFNTRAIYHNKNPIRYLLSFFNGYNTSSIPGYAQSNPIDFNSFWCTQILSGAQTAQEIKTVLTQIGDIMGFDNANSLTMVQQISLLFISRPRAVNSNNQEKYDKAFNIWSNKSLIYPFKLKLPEPKFSREDLEKSNAFLRANYFNLPASLHYSDLKITVTPAGKSLYWMKGSRFQNSYDLDGCLNKFFSIEPDFDLNNPRKATFTVPTGSFDNSIPLRSPEVPWWYASSPHTWFENVYIYTDGKQTEFDLIAELPKDKIPEILAYWCIKEIHRSSADENTLRNPTFLSTFTKLVLASPDHTLFILRHAKKVMPYLEHVFAVKKLLKSYHA